MIKIAAIQITSGDDMAANIAAVTLGVRNAAAEGAELICLPENSFYMRREGTASLADVPMVEHPGVLAMQALAQEVNAMIAIGSIRALEQGNHLPFNRSVVIAPSGEIIAYYDKIHLFDVQLPDGHHYRESSQARPGVQPVMVRTPMVNIGLSICYDLRFPALYRALAGAGAEVMLVPSAFTRPTGEAHWHTLLRARAIENGCYVVAAAQCGTHPGGRETYGHSIIINPWGQVLAEADGDTPGMITATIDRARVTQVRANMPVLEHQRLIGKVEVAG